MAASGFLISEGKFLYPQTLFEFLNTHPKLAPAAFIAVYVMMTLLLLPTLPLNLGAGFLWGPYWGGSLHVDWRVVRRGTRLPHVTLLGG